MKKGLLIIDVQNDYFWGGSMELVGIVDTTVRVAFDLGYSCTVIEDGCATRDLEFGGMKVEAAQVQAAFMAALSSPFAKISSTRSLAS